jgi:hypothetical protein
MFSVLLLLNRGTGGREVCCGRMLTVELGAEFE